jgi:hypothetical protein
MITITVVVLVLVHFCNYVYSVRNMPVPNMHVSNTVSYWYAAVTACVPEII